MTNIRQMHHMPQFHELDCVELLLRQLGYEMSTASVYQRLGELFPDPENAIFVAYSGDEIQGLVVLHRLVMLHLGQPIARITTLVVKDTVRRCGVGRQLVEAAAEWARKEGCGRLELTTGLDRTDAQAFYEALGFERASVCMMRDPSAVSVAGKPTIRTRPFPKSRWAGLGDAMRAELATMTREEFLEILELGSKIHNFPDEAGTARTRGS